MTTHVQSNVIGISDKPVKPPNSWLRTTSLGFIPGDVRPCHLSAPQDSHEMKEKTESPLNSTPGILLCVRMALHLTGFVR